MIEEYLRARSAGAGFAHRPEIVGRGNADDAVLGQPRDLAPKREGLVVLGINRYQEPLLVEAVVLRDQRPGKLDGGVLEVVAEREIAQHLEESMVARRIADIVEIVVLAAGAHAFLRGGRALERQRLHAGEDVLELHHARIGEHERRIVARHKRAGRHMFMAVLAEEIDECSADIVEAAHNQLLFL